MKKTKAGKKIIDGLTDALAYELKERKRLAEIAAIVDDEEQPVALTCQDCGVTSYRVMDTIDPYMEEIHGEERPVHLCPECHQESIWAI